MTGDAPAGGRRQRAAPVVWAACAAGWLAFTLAHLLLSGRAWWWVLPDLLPPPVYVLAPLLILVAWCAVYAARRPPVGWGARTALACAVAALALGAQGSGLNLAALTNDPSTPPTGSVRIASWDTLFWHQDEDPDRFFAYLKSLDADVYLLQEYMVQGDDGPDPVDDTARLRTEFPGYTLASRGELLTLSRLPIVGEEVLTASPMTPLSPWADYWDARVLRTDLLVAGQKVSVYNVHIADPFDLGQSPLTRHFYTSIHQLAAYRSAQWRVLGADIRDNPDPVVVSGTLNTLPNMGELRHLAPLRDAVAAGTSVYPVSFALRGAWLWRLDATYTSADVHVSGYELHDPSGLSTHKAQVTTIDLGT
ncbi:endonuclease/exonuclease/phosphatase family protein [Kitasatospora sp. NBC_01539]|uniref:endonuclease/exonuclease/phosphatase family protein n=1 Tax=Kitasatospora sp. NBC_01539 TaxID=2903577 RepID=UPI00386014E1